MSESGNEKAPDALYNYVLRKYPVELGGRMEDGRHVTTELALTVINEAMNQKTNELSTIQRTVDDRTNELLNTQKRVGDLQEENHRLMKRSRVSDASVDDLVQAINADHNRAIMTVRMGNDQQVLALIQQLQDSQATNADQLGLITSLGERNDAHEENLRRTEENLRRTELTLQHAQDQLTRTTTRLDASLALNAEHTRHIASDQAQIERLDFVIQDNDRQIDELNNVIEHRDRRVSSLEIGMRHIQGQDANLEEQWWNAIAAVPWTTIATNIAINVSERLWQMATNPLTVMTVTANVVRWLWRTET